MQIVHQRANHLLQISSYRVNLCLEITALLVNQLLFLMKIVAIFNSKSNRIFPLIKALLQKSFWKVALRNIALIYVKIILSERIENISSASTLQTIKRWNYYAKGYLRICTAWTSWSLGSASEFFLKHCCIFELETDLRNFFRSAGIKRLYCIW